MTSKDLPLVSIICLCYNHSKFVVEAIDSALNQTYSNIELIVVDDASNDRSTEVIKEKIAQIPDIKFIGLDKNVGNCSAFNIGWRASKGQFIIDLAADDVLLPKRVSSGVEKLLRVGSTYGVNFSDARIIDLHGDTIGKHLTTEFIDGPVPEGIIFQDLLRRYFINPVTMMYTRDLLENLQGYDEDLAYEDLDLWVRSSQKFKYCFSNEVLVCKRNLKSSHSRGQYRPGSKILLSTYAVCVKAFDLCETKKDFSALKTRLNYEVKMAVLSFNLKVATRMLQLRSRINQELN